MSQKQKDRGTIQSQQTFTVKGQRENILSFVGHMVSIITIQLCHLACKQPQTTQMNNNGFIYGH